MSSKITLQQIGFTDLERKRLEVLVKTRDYEKAAKKLGVSVSTVRQTTFRLRLRKAKCNEFLEEFEKFRRALGANCTYLNMK